MSMWRYWAVVALVWALGAVANVLAVLVADGGALSITVAVVLAAGAAAYGAFADIERRREGGLGITGTP